MSKPWLLCLGLSVLSLAAQAQSTTYRCQENGKTIYSDKPCAGNAQGGTVDTSAANSGDVRTAQRQAEQEKRAADRVVRERRKQIDQDYKAQQRAEAQAARHKKRCDQLAMRSKWAKEDVDKGGTVRHIRKSETRRKHAEEAYALECK